MFGKDATFLGTVHAKEMEGDVTDVKIKNSLVMDGFITRGVWHTLATFTVSGMPFARTFKVDGGIHIYGDEDEFANNNWSWYRVTKNNVEIYSSLAGGLTSPVVDYLASRTSGNDVYRIQAGVSSAEASFQGGAVGNLIVKAQKIAVSCFKEGGTIS